MPLLLGTVAVKYIALALNQFKSKRNFFWQNVANYVIFVLIAFLLDYSKEFFG